MRMLGILGTKISPPRIRSMHRIAKATPSSSRIQKRVMSGSVTVTVPVRFCSAKSGMTLPRLPMTLP